MTSDLPASPTVLVQRLHPERDADLPLPAYQTAGAAGADVCAALTEPLTVAPLQRVRVPTGLAMAIPAGFEIQVRPRSGLAARDGITVLNAPGTIDSDYRGELQILLVNLSDQPVQLRRGDRVAQLIVAPVVQAQFQPVASLDVTLRGAGGFGSTGRT